MLPPVENLWKFIDNGADMVAFSGGKAIMGPQSTGILCGRRDLIEAAALNHSPNTAIGRTAKVCKEEIVGLMVALERYVQRDHSADQRRWHAQCETIAAAIADIRGVKTDILQDSWIRPVPELSIHLTMDWAGPSPAEIVDSMAKCDPAIIIGGSQRRCSREQLFVNPHVLIEEEAELIGQRLRIAMMA
jgi:L-seryl-tRNA(Ser) seleniumtransferase